MRVEDSNRAVMLTGGSGGVVFKVGCGPGYTLASVISLSVVELDGCRASAVLYAYLVDEYSRQGWLCEYPKGVIFKINH